MTHDDCLRTVQPLDTSTYYTNAACLQSTLQPSIPEADTTGVISSLTDPFNYSYDQQLQLFDVADPLFTDATDTWNYSYDQQFQLFDVADPLFTNITVAGP